MKTGLMGNLPVSMLMMNIRSTYRWVQFTFVHRVGVGSSLYGRHVLLILCT